MIALPPALATAGACRGGSLWPVEDVSTSFLVERFVHHLLDPGEIPATALLDKQFGRADVVLVGVVESHRRS